MFFFGGNGQYVRWLIQVGWQLGGSGRVYKDGLYARQWRVIQSYATCAPHKGVNLDVKS